MTEHDWAPIAPPEDPAIMCNTCLQCKCCSEVTEECPGEWVPSEEDLETRDFLDQWGGVPNDEPGFSKRPTERSRELVRDWLEGKRAEREDYREH